MPKVNNKVLNAIGALLTLLSIGFVFTRSKTYLAQLPPSTITTNSFLFLIGLGFVYAAAQILLVMAWRFLLASNAIKLPFRMAFVIWGRSQIAKYVPGNIFHIAGKQVLLTQNGADALPAGKANAAELFSLAGSALLLGWWVIPALFPTVRFVEAVVGWLVTNAIIGMVLYKRRKAILSVWFYQSVFLIISGFLFVGLIRYFGGAQELKFSQSVTTSGIYILSWLVGFITPGASAGLGIRESVLFLLGGGISTETIALSSLSMRVVSIIGDVVIFIVSILLGNGGFEKWKN